MDDCSNLYNLVPTGEGTYFKLVFQKTFSNGIWQKPIRIWSQSIYEGLLLSWSFPNMIYFGLETYGVFKHVKCYIELQLLVKEGQK